MNGLSNGLNRVSPNTIMASTRAPFPPAGDECATKPIHKLLIRLTKFIGYAIICKIRPRLEHVNRLSAPVGEPSPARRLPLSR